MAYQPKSYRRFLASSVSAAVVASAAAAVPADVQQADAAESFSDVSNDYWASESIQRLADEGIINGYPDGTYGPGEEINRGQVAELLVNAFDLEVNQDAETSYDDLTDESYYTPFAEAVTEAGYITGRQDGTQFAAGMDLSREQMATILVRAFDLEAKEDSDAEVADLDEANASHQENIEILAQYEITSTENNMFRPKETVNRAQFATFLDRALEVQEPLEIANVDALTDDGHVLEVSFTRPYREDIDPSDVMISESDSGERKGVESVDVSPDGLTAQVTLFDNTDEDADPEIERLQEYDIQVGDLESTFIRPGFTDEVRVTDVDLDDETISAGGATYNVEAEDFDYYQALGAEISIWYDQDDNIVDHEFEDEDVEEGAIEVNSDADEIDVVNPNGDNDTYDLADEEDFNFYLNGDSADIEADAEYDYAKVYFDNNDNVEAVHAYNFEDSVLNNEVDGNYVLGFDSDEVDLSDHLIVKNGKQISVDDIQQNDLVFFNEDAEENGIAVVTDETVTGQIDGVYQDSFDIDGENFEYGSAQYVNEDNEIETLDEDGAEMLEDSGEEVTAHFNWKGDLVIVSGGQEGDLQEQYETSYTTDSIVAYQDNRGNDRVELSLVNREGNENLYDFEITSLDEIVVQTADGEVEYEVDQDLPEEASNSFEIDEFQLRNADSGDEDFAFDIVATDGNGGEEVVKSISADEALLMGIDTNDSEDVAGLKFFNNGETFTETVETDDDFVEAENGESYRLQSSTQVVNVDSNDTYPDADDVTTMDWSEVQDNGNDINEGTVYYDEDGYVTHIETSDLDVANTTDYSAVLTRVDVNSDDEVARVEALVNGERETYDVNDLESSDMDNADIDNLTEGTPVVLEVNDDNNQVTDIKETDDSSVNRHVEGTVENVEVGNNTITVDGTEYQLESDAEVYDVTDSDSDDYSVESLRDIENGDDVSLILAAGGSTFVDAVVRTNESSGNGGSGGAETDGEVTYINTTANQIDVGDETYDIPAGSALDTFLDGGASTGDNADELEGLNVAVTTNNAGEAIGLEAVTLEEESYSSEFINGLVQDFEGITVEGVSGSQNDEVTSNVNVTQDGVTLTDFTIDGNLTVDGDNFTSVENTITGDVTVNGQNASFNTTIEGDVTIAADASATFDNVEFAATSSVTIEGEATISGSTGNLDASNITVNGSLDASNAEDQAVQDVAETATNEATVTDAVYALEENTSWDAEQGSNVSTRAEEIVNDSDVSLELSEDTTSDVIDASGDVAADATIGSTETITFDVYAGEVTDTTNNITVTVVQSDEEQAAVDAVANASDQVELDDALQNDLFSNYNSDLIAEYEAAIDPGNNITTDSTVADIQAEIDSVNSAN
ncbi:S-layer homology domain-containing protein [Salibacterium sp. K-3]